MNISDEEKLKYLIEAGGKHLINEKFIIMPVFGNMNDAIAFGELPQEEQDRILAEVPQDEEPQDAVSIYGKENLVKIIMPDEGMYPEIFYKDELTIAFREEIRDGDLAAVSMPGLSYPVTIREISYDKDNIWLIPHNEVYPVDCCSPDKVIIGKPVAISREL